VRENVAVCGRKSEQGSSLVEVVMALGLLGAVMGSIAGLFVIGASGVNSGRTVSQALSGARTIVEEMQDWRFDELHENFGLDGTASSYLIDTRGNGDTAEWQAELSETLPGAFATIELVSLEPGSPYLKDSTQVRVTVTIRWSEGTRNRSVRLAMVRI